MGAGFSSGVGVGAGAAGLAARLPDWEKASVPKMRMRIKAVLIRYRFFELGPVYSSGPVQVGPCRAGIF